LSKFYLRIQSAPSTPRPSDSLFPSGFPTKFSTHLASPHAHYMPHPSQRPWFHRPNNICWRVQIIEVLIMQFSPAPSLCFPSRSRHPHKLSFSAFFPLTRETWFQDQF
jgi:hypothetical protein